MPVQTAYHNSVFAELLVAELLRQGIDYFCISPGSRSTPLTAAVARHPHARAIVCHDERGGAFHALGYARAAGKPAALICTSGTAAAHYFPAVIEAAMDFVPMLALTADRPPELWRTGANQTITQPRLFGEYTKWHFELPCPDDAASLEMLLSTVAQAVYQAQATPAGPVQLNCPFREPLLPAPATATAAQHPRAGKAPFTHYAAPVRTAGGEALSRLNQIIETTASGLVVVGRLHSGAEQTTVGALLQALRWPVFADVTSGLRLQSHPAVIPYFEHLLRVPELTADYRPDSVIHIGGRITSARLYRWLDDIRPPHYLVIADHPFRHDPLHRVTLRIEADIAACCSALQARLPPVSTDPWLARLRTCSDRIDELLAQETKPEQRLDEIATARLISRYIPTGHGLWLGNSMPIRDMDSYGFSQSAVSVIGANRGASGIDGAIASAAGFAVGLQRPVTVLLGDLALLHDLNSLLLLNKINPPLIIVGVNNDGGGIFSFLPVAQHPDIFEEYFGTPHRLRFETVAQLFALNYAAPQTNGDFVTAYRTALAAERPTLIEVASDRPANVTRHRQIQAAIAARLASLP